MNRQFAASLTVEKKHNSTRALHAKVTMRRNVLDVVGRSNAHVFDAFAGPGEMFRGAWDEAASYTGCDEEWFRDERRVFVADNKVVLRALDLSKFTVFDLDAYGSPWECATILAARRKVLPGETVGLCLTDGSGLKLKMSGVPHALARLCGISGNMRLANRGHDVMIDRALAEVAARMGATIVRRWQAHDPARAAMHYMAVVLTG